MRATAGIRRLVVIGHTGVVTLDALRWLADIGAAFVHIDADGRVIAATGPAGLDHPALRWAQARAIDAPDGLAIARELIEVKLPGRQDVLAKLPESDAAITEIDRCLSLLEGASTTQQVMQLEAAAAGAYWAAWPAVPMTFAREDRARIPEHWRTFGSRRSPLSASAHNAITPANALLNYLYAILETEARIAALAVGLDPGLGVLHADQRARDSFACDLMETVRPRVDAYLLDLLGSHTFRAADFIELRSGVCRVSSTLRARLAETWPTS